MVPAPVEPTPLPQAASALVDATAPKPNARREISDCVIVLPVISGTALNTGIVQLNCTLGVFSRLVMGFWPMGEKML
jgi:hypothetical protein